MPEQATDLHTHHTSACRDLADDCCRTWSWSSCFSTRSSSWNVLRCARRVCLPLQLPLPLLMTMLVLLYPALPRGQTEGKGRNVSTRSGRVQRRVQKCRCCRLLLPGSRAPPAAVLAAAAAAGYAVCRMRSQSFCGCGGSWRRSSLRCRKTCRCDIRFGYSFFFWHWGSCVGAMFELAHLLWSQLSGTGGLEVRCMHAHKFAVATTTAFQLCDVCKCSARTRTSASVTALRHWTEC